MGWGLSRGWAYRGVGLITWVRLIIWFISDLSHGVGLITWVGAYPGVRLITWGEAYYIGRGLSHG